MDEDLQKLLSLAESIETMAAELYERYHDAFAADEEAAYLFYHLHVEEKSHVALVRYTSIIAKHGTASVRAEALETGPLQALHSRLTAELAKPAPATLKEAVQTALELEVTLGEGYVKTRLAAAGAATARLVASLAEKEHAGQLVTFAKSRHIL